MKKAYLLRETDSEDGRGFKDVGIALSKEDAIAWKDLIQETSLHFRRIIEYSVYQPERSKREDTCDHEWGSENLSDSDNPTFSCDKCGAVL